jgi:signal transduction histidine kinase/DNA-binding response OmpR family regulator
LNVYGKTGQEAIFKFRILPPWYGTWWAYLIYVLFFSLAVFLAVRWRFKKLEQEKLRLEQQVKERTKEISRKNLQLLDQAERLKELDHAKSRFFAGISHEFRTPLTLIIGPLEQMLAQGTGGEINNKLGMMHRNAARLLTLINNLLDLSRIDSGKMKIQPVSQDMILFLKGILSTFEHQARENELKLRFLTDRESVFLYFDAERMEDIFLNLISNAVKFTPAGGEITASVSCLPEKEEDFPQGFLRISVRDTGTGIPQDQLNHIFDLFYQVESNKQKHKGSGIGLALVRELVNLHHGKIDVHSRQDENSGTEFILRFPLGEVHLQEEPPAQPIAPDTNVEEPGANQKFLEVKEPFFQKGSLPPEAEESPRNTILIVEDNPDMRQFIRESIESYYVVEEAGDGREGIDKAQALTPDLIISDIMMPDIDGYELCRTIKNDLRTSHIPVIFLTAKASDESRLQGLETRADDYITKPFNNRILLSRIKNLIDLRRQLQEKFQRHMRLEPAEIDVSSIDQKFLEKLHGVIEECLSDFELNVESLSEKMEISRVTLNKKILALTGETANEFIRSYRLKRAVQLLEKRAGNITDIAMEVGFSSSAYFTKCFKEKFNRLPSEYID